MKHISLVFIISSLLFSSACSQKKETKELTLENTTAPAEHKSLFLDVHNLEPGKVKLEDVAGAHQKDLATQDKFGTNFMKYWVDEAAGKVYCLVEARDSAAVYHTHKEAHGLVPDLVQKVTDGPEARIVGDKTLFLDVHKLGAGNVTAADVAGAHDKDLATQGKFGVNFINYWVDEASGTVTCLSEAQNSEAVVNTHKEAHGLIPQEIHEVKQGN